MGLGGVGDSKGLMESELRQRHIRWITNAKVTEVGDGHMQAVEHDVCSFGIFSIFTRQTRHDASIPSPGW